MTTKSERLEDEVEYLENRVASLIRERNAAQAEAARYQAALDRIATGKRPGIIPQCSGSGEPMPDPVQTTPDTPGGETRVKRMWQYLCCLVLGHSGWVSHGPFAQVLHCKRCGRHIRIGVD